jgi:hypothetical protein
MASGTIGIGPESIFHQFRLGTACDHEVWSGSLSSVVERVCFARTRSVGSIHSVAPAHFVSQAGSLVTRSVLVADATFKRPKDFFCSVLDSSTISETKNGLSFCASIGFSRPWMSISLAYKTKPN